MSPARNRDPFWELAAVLILAAGAMTLAGTEAPWAGLICALGVHVPLLLAAWRLTAARAAPTVSRPCSAWRLLLAGYVYFSTLIALGLLLGCLGCLTPLMLLAASALVAACLLRATRGRIPRSCPESVLKVPWRRRLGGADTGGTPVPQRFQDAHLVLPAACPPVRDRHRPSLLGVVLMLVVLFALWRGLTHADYDYDVLTYHLTFPARWFQDGAMTLIPTWCGDPAPAYAPLATELYYAGLILPLGDDTLARCGQLPFWLLMLCAVHALTGELRLRRAARNGTVLAVALLPSLAGQAATAMVDVAFAAHLAAVVCFALRLVRRVKPADAAGLALAGGLLLGTKYLAIVFLVAFLPVLAWVKWRCLRVFRARLAKPAVVAALLLAYWIGGYWYVRNFVATGNPFYPFRLAVGRTVLFDGAYGRPQMENSPFNLRRRGVPDAFGRTVWQALHASDEPLPAPDDSTGVTASFHRWYLGPFGLLAGLFLAATVAVCLTEPRDRPRRLLVHSSIAMSLALFWFLLPFQQARFAWGPLVLGAAAAAQAVRLHRRAGPVVLLLVLFVCWRAFEGEIARGLPDSATGWLAVGAAGAVILLARGWVSPGATRAASLCRSPAFGVAAFFASVLIAVTLAPDARLRAFALPRWRFIGPAWAWIDRELHGKTVAYVGNNVPYFLLGRGFENRVLYVPARESARGRFHDYAAAPEAARLGPPNTSEPVPDRYRMDPEAWFRNLRRLKVDYVVVNSMLMFPNLLINLRHDPLGFPIERTWLDALARPSGDRPAWVERRDFSQGGVRLYKLALPDAAASPAGWPSIVRDETDALDRLRQDGPPAGAPIRDYPHARPIIKRYHLRALREPNGRRDDIGDS
ncbi:MAG: hypothetical protein ACE5FL_09670 [Myxococcota bacterium]